MEVLVLDINANEKIKIEYGNSAVSKMQLANLLLDYILEMRTRKDEQVDKK
jgi:hypothetical protein